MGRVDENEEIVEACVDDNNLKDEENQEYNEIEKEIILIEKKQRSAPPLVFKDMSADDFQQELRISKKKYVYQCNQKSTLIRVSINEMIYDQAKRIIKIDDFEVYPHNVFASIPANKILPGRMFAAYLKIFNQRKSLYAVNVLLSDSDCKEDEVHVNIFVANFQIYKSVNIKRSCIKLQLQFTVADVLTKGTTWTWNRKLKMDESQKECIPSITENIDFDYVSENPHDTFGNIQRIKMGYIADDREMLAKKRIHKSNETLFCTKNGYLCSIILSKLFLVNDCGPSFTIKGKNIKGVGLDKVLLEIFLIMQKNQDQATGAVSVASKAVRVVRSIQILKEGFPKTVFRYDGLFKLEDITKVGNEFRYLFNSV